MKPFLFAAIGVLWATQANAQLVPDRPSSLDPSGRKIIDDIINSGPTSKNPDSGGLSENYADLVKRHAQCPMCGGTTECRHCNGSGTDLRGYRCSQCSGTGVCTFNVSTNQPRSKTNPMVWIGIVGGIVIAIWLLSPSKKAIRPNRDGSDDGT